MSYPTGPGAPCPRCPGTGALVTAIEQHDGVRWRCSAGGPEDWHYVERLASPAAEAAARAEHGDGDGELPPPGPVLGAVVIRTTLAAALVQLAHRAGTQLGRWPQAPQALRDELTAVIDLLISERLDVLTPLYDALEHALTRQARRERLATQPEDLT